MISFDWNQSKAVDMCRHIEEICPAFGCHVALTGGLLYKDGPRKDADILFYRIWQTKKINMAGLWAALKTVGFVKKSGCGWCYKAEYFGKPVDCFFPEAAGGPKNKDGKYNLESSVY